MNNKKNIIITSIALALILLISSSYALLRNSSRGNNKYTMNTANLEISFKNGIKELRLNRAYPISDEVGLGQDYELVFTIKNTGNLPASYNLYIDEISTNPEFKSVIKYIDKKGDGDFSNIKILSEDNYIDRNGIIDIGEEITYRVKCWLREEADSTYMNKEFKARIVVESSQATKINLNANGGNVSPSYKLLSVSATTYGELPEPTKTNSNFLGWFTDATGGTEVTAETPFTYGSSTQTLYAHWEVQEITIDALKGKVGTGGLVAINSNGDLATGSDTIREYRYSGGETTVNNYVKLNNEYWRIIGIFKGETIAEAGTSTNPANNPNDWNIKLIREEALPPLTSDQLSYTSTDTTDGGTFTLGTTNTYNIRVGEHATTQPQYLAGRYYWNNGGQRSGYNDWVKSGLRFYLNEESNPASWYYNTFKKSGAVLENYEKYIATTNYSLRTVGYKVTPKVAYNQERGLDTTYSLREGNSETWTGKIALPYSSDYGYATDVSVWNETNTTTTMFDYSDITNIQTRNWFLRNVSTGIYWLLSPSSSLASNALIWFYSGDVGYGGVDSRSYLNNTGLDVRAVLNLKSTTIFKSDGDGSPEHPYEISET